MSSNSFLVDSGSKGWCNIFAQNITAYDDLNVGNNIVQNGNVVNLPNANNDIEVKDLTAHGQVSLVNDNNTNGDVVFQVLDGQGGTLMKVDATNSEIEMTKTVIGGNLTAGGINVNGNLNIDQNGDLGTVGGIACNEIIIGNGSSPINKFDTVTMNMAITENNLVAPGQQIGFSAFRMGNVSPGGRSLVNITIDSKSIQTKNGATTDFVTFNAIPNIFRPNSDVTTVASFQDSSNTGYSIATLNNNGIVTILDHDGSQLNGNGNNIELISNIVFTFNQIGN